MTFEVSALEKKFGLTLPEDFTCILRLIDLSTLNLEYYDESEKFFFRLTKWIHFEGGSGNDLKIDSFFKRDNLSEVWERHLELWGTLNFIPFASTSDPANGLILLCTTPSNYGEIWYSKHGEREPVFLVKNISIFMNSTRQVIREEKKSKLDKLLRRSNENFWRIASHSS